MGLSPDIFWQMTTAEFNAFTRGWRWKQGWGWPVQGLGREQYQQLKQETGHG
jgi:hypothetical protein